MTLQKKQLSDLEKSEHLKFFCARSAGVRIGPVSDSMIIVDIRQETNMQLYYIFKSADVSQIFLIS